MPIQHPTIFWILTTPRSGSNFVTGELWRRIGGMPKGMEYFNPDSIARRRDFAPDPAAPVRSYLDYLVPRESIAGILAVKMLWVQIASSCQYPDFLAQLADRRIVCLRRRDLIRQGISLYIARQTKAWASGAAPRLLRPEDVRYDHVAIAGEVARMELHNALLGRFLATFGLDHATVWYEDFVAAPDAESDRLLAYLGLARATSALSKATPFERQSSELNERLYGRFIADERARLLGDGLFRGPPLFPAVDAPGPRSP